MLEAAVDEAPAGFPQAQALPRAPSSGAFLLTLRDAAG